MWIMKYSYLILLPENSLRRGTASWVMCATGWAFGEFENYHRERRKVEVPPPICLVIQIGSLSFIRSQTLASVKTLCSLAEKWKCLEGEIRFNTMENISERALDCIEPESFEVLIREVMNGAARGILYVLQILSWTG